MGLPTRSVDPDDVGTFAGELHEWTLGNPGNPRSFVIITMTYAQARKWLKAETYDHRTGQGWQREQIETHVRKLRKDMAEDRFTPVPWIAGLTEWHTKCLFHPAHGEDDPRRHQGRHPASAPPARRLAAVRRHGAGEEAGRGREGRGSGRGSSTRSPSSCRSSSTPRTSRPTSSTCRRAVRSTRTRSSRWSGTRAWSSSEKMPFVQMAHKVCDMLQQEPAVAPLRPGPVRFDAQGGRSPTTR